MEDSPEIQTAPPSNEQKDLKQLFYLSFRYSQGSMDVQDKLFSWLVKNRYIDKNQVTEDTRSFITSITYPGKNHVEDDTVKGSLDKMWDYLNRADGNYNGNLEEDIAEGIIRRDLKYLEDEGRPNRNQENLVVPDSQNDPHASFFRKFILHGQSSGHVAFDTLFSSIRQNVNTSQTEEWLKIKDDLQKLSSAWQEHHPDHSFFAPDPTPIP